MDEVLARLKRIEDKLDTLLGSKPAQRVVLRPPADQEIRLKLNRLMYDLGDNIRKVRAAFFNWKEGQSYDPAYEIYFSFCEDLYLNGIDKDFQNSRLTEDQVVNGKFKDHEQSKQEPV